MPNVYSHHHIYSLCHQNMNQYVVAHTADGKQIDGIISGVDQHYVYLDVPIREQQRIDMRFGPGFGFGYPFWGWRRIILPLTALVALTALGPWFWW